MSDSYIYQEKVKELILTGHSVILQAPTGAGKTRTALTPFLDTFWDERQGVCRQLPYLWL